jgi:hypothetical protein
VCTNLDVKVYFLPGNHENHEMLEAMHEQSELTEEGFSEPAQNVFYTGRVNSWEWYGKRFAAVGGAYSIDKDCRVPGRSWWSQELLTPDEIKAAREIGFVDYLFTHDAPRMNPFQFLKSDLDSEINRSTMSSIAAEIVPERWFHGHYHVREDYEFRRITKVHALDRDGRPGNMVFLDVEANQLVKLDKHSKA